MLTNPTKESEEQPGVGAANLVHTAPLRAQEDEPKHGPPDAQPGPNSGGLDNLSLPVVSQPTLAEPWGFHKDAFEGALGTE